MSAPKSPPPAAHSRSPERMRPADTGLLLVDLQEQLLAVEPARATLIWNARRLLDGANILGVRAAATEQYPEKLGPTTPLLAERLALPAAGKLAFSCAACSDIFSEWRSVGIHRVLVCGIETHICVQQTVLDLMADGFQVLVAADAVGARHAMDHKMALRRMEASGALLSTTEAALFEWCAQAGTPEFKQISALAKETCPQ
ncbi:MAG: isochorismatase family protein [Pirellulales bacterium]|nr:isochorismatase family protein [Pirellulales bacterium]